MHGSEISVKALFVWK